MKLNLYDKELNRIAFLDENFISCLWKENYNSTGTLTLELSATEELKTLVKPDCYVGRWDRDTLMVIKSVTLADNKLTCNGFTADRQLDDVAYIGTINDGAIVVNAIKNAYSKTEGYPLFSIADSDISDKYPSQISHKSILTLLKTMCEAADIGYKAVKVDKTIQIQFYKPGDNNNLKFSKDYGNLQDFSLFHSTAALKNYAIVMGAGEGDNRAKAEVDIRNDKTEQKRAVIIDAKDIQYEDGDTDASYKQKLIARGLEKLLDYQPVKEVDFSPIYTLGADYDLGDILTALLNDYGLKIKSRITSYTQKQQNNSIQTTVELGDKQTRTMSGTVISSGGTASSAWVKKTGDTMSGDLHMQGSNIVFDTFGADSNDSGDIVWRYGNGKEKMRLYAPDSTLDSDGQLFFRSFAPNGNQIFDGRVFVSGQGDFEISQPVNNKSIYKIVCDWDIGGWSNYGMTFAVSSRHSGNGIVTIEVNNYNSNVSASTLQARSILYGSDYQLDRDNWKLYATGDRRKVYLLWRAYDYNDTWIRRLANRGGKSLYNGDWISDPSSLGVQIATLLVNP